MRVKRIIYFLLIGIIGLNSIYSFTSANFEQEIVKSRDKLDELCVISNQKNDFQIPMDNSDESTEIYGFELIFPNDNQYFQTFPSITLNITNSTIVGTYEYESKISSKVPSLSIENSFDPENLDDWGTFMNDLEFVWNQIEDSIQISIDFTIINGESGIPLYKSAIFKDLTAPLFTFGYEFDNSSTLIPYDGSKDYFNTNPYIYFNITDNLENVVDICLTINTHLHQISNLVSEFSPSNKQEMINITLPEWDEMNEGSNAIPIFLIDSAGNPTAVEWLHIKKDTSPPEFRSNLPNNAWLRVGLEDIAKYENPIYNKYEINENPIFNCQFTDDDIVNVKLVVDLPEIELEFEDDWFTRHLSGDPEIDQNEKYKMYLYAVQVNNIDWVIEFPNKIWDQLQNQDMKMNIILNDYAGNIASHDFTVKHVSASSNFTLITENSLTSIILGVVLYIIALVSFLSLSSRSVNEKYNPLEEDLKKIDPELLEIVISPLDQENLINVVKYCRDLKNPAEYDKILPPQIHDFLKIPLQILNLKEIHLLLTRYKMDSLQLEDFERHQFLLDYMENHNSETDNLEFADNELDNGDINQ